jgi:hypothetical protein
MALRDVALRLRAIRTTFAFPETEFLHRKLNRIIHSLLWDAAVNSFYIDYDRGPSFTIFRYLQVHCEQIVASCSTAVIFDRTLLAVLLPSAWAFLQSLSFSDMLNIETLTRTLPCVPEPS